MLTWLRTTTAHQILGEIAHTAEPFTHADMDRYPPGNIVEQLRGILTAGGVLPQRDDHLVRLQRWITHAVQDVADPAERRIVYSFATWHHLRRLRRQSERRQITDGQAERARNTIRAAINLTGWLEARGTRLADCTQADIDQWLADGPASRRAARPFITWTDQHGHTHDVQIPPATPSVRITRITDDQRWATVKRLLHDEHLAAADRVAGLLVLLYGQSLTHITLLTRDKIIATPDGIQLLLGDVPVVLPAPLGALVDRLDRDRYGSAVIGRTDTHPWLFPGRTPGRPLSIGRLKARLAAIGVIGRTARNTALIDLASQLPPAVLARLLGIDINTAGAWAERAARSGAAYAADLTRRPSFDRS